MWLSILKTFLDGREKYHAGELRYVEDEDAAMRFLGLNRAKRAEAPETAPAAPKTGEPVSLEVHRAVMGMKEHKHG